MRSNLEIGFLLSTLGMTRGGLETTAMCLGKILADRGHRIRMVGGSWPGHSLPPDLAAAPATWLRVPALLESKVLARIGRPGWSHIARSTTFNRLCRFHPGVRRLMSGADITMTFLARETASFSEWRARMSRAHISYFSGGDAKWLDRDASVVRLMNPSVAVRKASQIAAHRIDGVLLPGISDSWFAPARPARDRGTNLTLLFVGRLEMNKGVMDLVEILAGLDPLTTLRLVGDGPLRKPLLEAAVRLGVDARCIFTGAQSHDRVHWEMCNADLLLLPTRHENFPLTLLESQAAGLPFVASDIEGIRNYVHARGRLLPPGEIALWQRTIAELLRDHTGRMNSGRDGIEWARQYRWSCVADEFETCCELALSRAGGRG